MLSKPHFSICSLRERAIKIANDTEHEFSRQMKKMGVPSIVTATPFTNSLESPFLESTKKQTFIKPEEKAKRRRRSIHVVVL